MRTLAMRTHTSATFLVAFALALAPALEFGEVGKFRSVGVIAAPGGTGGGSSKTSTAGGTNAGASAGAKAGKSSGAASNQGTSVGSGVASGGSGGSPGTSAGGGTKAGASAGVKAGKNSGTSGNVGHKSGGKLTGAGRRAAVPKGKGAPPASSGALAGPVVGAGTPKKSSTPNSVRARAIAGIAPATGASPSVGLPSALWPVKIRLGERGEYEQGIFGNPVTDPMITGAISDGAGGVVRACLQAITSAALPLGAVRIRATSAGPLVRQRDGALIAPITVRIEYAAGGLVEVRQARVRCHLDSNGLVVVVT
ncbi:hypothetical protein ATY30_12570 [Sinorhizobium americanum]|nr:hypothetical protein CO664_09005 [Sinorhizobium sp. NG07B]POH32205.1 hypothetical protein ATY30_12570 [Sinorhizobium americanum]